MDGSPAAMETEEEAAPELTQTAELEEAMSDEMRSLAARMREEEEEDAVVVAEDEILAQIEKLVKVITQEKERIPVGSQEEEAEARKSEEEEATWTVIPIEETETVEGNRKIEGGIVKVEAVMAPAWLPPEWLVITRRRKSGRSKGNKDKETIQEDENPSCKPEASGNLHNPPLIQQVGECSSVSTSTEEGQAKEAAVGIGGGGERKPSPPPPMDGGLSRMAYRFSCMVIIINAC
ncbi:hypothetical protein OPV22_024659 [Ensete ventricosum]|uniref:Uncharacterized protein n=1 Tax=Ensete ventricosum TaxID=4639 RepID=A0AAV8Q5B0_ENSVE|nr:hypothetical protein OPV22_024659 [Ensete ventricosum]